MFNLESISHIWNVIVESNTFNFIFFVAVFVLIFKKINIKGMFNSLHQKIIDTIELAKTNRESALKKLEETEKSISDLPVVIDSMLQEAEKNAEIFGEKIIKEAHKQIESIEMNAKKVIDAEGRMLISKLTQGTSKASIERATQQINQAFSQNPELHDKYIDDSIEQLDRLNF